MSALANRFVACLGRRFGGRCGGGGWLKCRVEDEDGPEFSRGV